MSPSIAYDAATQVRVTRRYRFCAQHRLHSDTLSNEENWKIFGKCNNPNGHGHNYVVYVVVRGPLDEATGQVVDVAALDAVVRQTVVERFDHRDLNQDPAFATMTTTGENLARLVWDLLRDRMPQGTLDRVGVVETRDNYFEYAGA
ncbi:MAG: 6-carboxytetrahydropterin synthase [Nitrospiraceae bacterium]